MAVAAATLASTACGGSDVGVDPVRIMVDADKSLQSFPVGDGDGEVPPGTYRVELADNSAGGEWWVCNVNPCDPYNILLDQRFRDRVGFGITDEGKYRPESGRRSDVIVIDSPPDALAVVITNGIELVRTDTDRS